MPKFVGAHVSFSRSEPQKTGMELSKIGAGAGAIFTRPPQSDSIRAPFAAGAVTLFDAGLNAARISKSNIIAHSGYIFNLASAKSRKPYLGRFLVEMQLAAQLGVDLVIHPGSAADGDVAAGIARVTEAINYVHAKTSGRYEGQVVGAGEAYDGGINDIGGAPGVEIHTPIWVKGACTNKVLVEYMGDAPIAKNGSAAIGVNLEHLAAILAGVEDKSRVGICLDTCHMFASGVNIADARVFDAFMRDFKRMIGAQYLRGCHMNNSLNPLGSGKDRHAPIRSSEGHIAQSAFEFLMKSPDFDDIPLVTETHLKSAHDMAEEIHYLYSLQNK